MILLVHMLFGAALGSLFLTNPLIALFFALLGHYFLDVFPHVEYSIANLSNKDWKKSIPDVLKIFLDFSLGVSIIFLVSNNKPIIYLCAFIAIFPDSLTLLSKVFPNTLLSIHDKLHAGKIHYLTKQKKFPFFWRIFSQVTAVIISIFILHL
jgi:hypothetical protein